MREFRAFRPFAWAGSAAAGSGVFRLDLTGLDGGEARPGTEAGIEMILPAGVGIDEQRWGVGFAGNAELGTGETPDPLGGRDGDKLFAWALGDDGRIYTGSAMIHHAAPVALVASAEITIDAGGDPVDLSELFAAFAGVPRFQLTPSATGLTLNSDTGVLTAVATAVSTSASSVRLADANTTTRFAQVALVITVTQPAVFAVLVQDGEIVIENAEGPLTIQAVGGPYDGTYTTDLDAVTLTQALVTAERFVPIARPQISGSTGLGDTLTAANGIWLIDNLRPVPALLPRWQSDDVDISGATALTYAITAPVQGTDVTVEIDAVEGADSVTAESLPKAVPPASGTVIEAIPGGFRVVSLADRTPLSVTAIDGGFRVTEGA